MQLAQTASQQLPKVPQVTDTLGWVYLKKISRAWRFRRCSRASKTTRRTRPTATPGLARQDGDKVKAKDQFDQALQLQPGMKEAEDARNALKSKS